MVPGTRGTEPEFPAGNIRSDNGPTVDQDTQVTRFLPVDLCRVCVILLVGLEGAQVYGLL